MKLHKTCNDDSILFNSIPLFTAIQRCFRRLWNLMTSSKCCVKSHWVTKVAAAGGGVRGCVRSGKVFRKKSDIRSGKLHRKARETSFEFLNLGRAEREKSNFSRVMRHLSFISHIQKKLTTKRRRKRVAMKNSSNQKIYNVQCSKLQRRRKWKVHARVGITSDEANLKIRRRVIILPRTDDYFFCFHRNLELNM